MPPIDLIYFTQSHNDVEAFWVVILALADGCARNFVVFVMEAFILPETVGSAINVPGSLTIPRNPSSRSAKWKARWARRGKTMSKSCAEGRIVALRVSKADIFSRSKLWSAIRSLKVVLLCGVHLGEASWLEMFKGSRIMFWPTGWNILILPRWVKPFDSEEAALKQWKGRIFLTLSLPNDINDSDMAEIVASGINIDEIATFPNGRKRLA